MDWQACTIRVMSLADMGEVRDILQESPEAAEWSEAVIGESLSVSRTVALVSEREGEISGCVFGTKLDGEAEILNLAIRRKHRRKGDGKRLVERIVEQWKQDGTTRVFLEVRESNKGAIQFYEGLGFRQVGRRKEYYAGPAEDALVLAREM
jgi:ribosomal-protein-alanine acetyltransferase